MHPAGAGGVAQLGMPPRRLLRPPSTCQLTAAVCALPAPPAPAPAPAPAPPAPPAPLPPPRPPPLLQYRAILLSIIVALPGGRVTTADGTGSLPVLRYARKTLPFLAVLLPFDQKTDYFACGAAAAGRPRPYGGWGPPPYGTVGRSPRLSGGRTSGDPSPKNTQKHTKIKHTKTPNQHIPPWCCP